MSKAKKSRGTSGKQRQPRSVPSLSHDAAKAFELIALMSTSKLEFILQSLNEQPTDPAAVKNEFERFMMTCRILMKRDPSWVVRPNVDDPLVRFALMHTFTGTIVSLNYPYNEVTVEGRAAFIMRSIQEKVPYGKWEKFCQGEVTTL